MKEFYEERAKSFLSRRIPAIIRVDGKTFHTFCRGMNKPFDDLVRTSMYYAADYMCRNIQGAKLAFVQSDEISILITDYDTPNASAWFDYETEKMVSVAASMAAVAFNHAFRENDVVGEHKSKYDTALFDARAMSVPQEEVNNYFIWRQLDAIRNSIQSLGQAHFTHTQLVGKRSKEVCEMLQEKGVDYHSVPLEFQRGACIRKSYVRLSNGENSYVRSRWILDKEIPLFTEDRDYVWRGVIEKRDVEAVL